MKILVLNRGSSSVKCSLFDWDRLPKSFEKPIREDKIEWKNVLEKGSSLFERGLRAFLTDMEVDCIGHRIVHGGKKYQKTTRIDSAVKEEIAKLADLAPLHNLADLEGIESLEKIFPEKPQFAVFDTAFHHTLPLEAKIYPGPYRWFKEGIQRYGFHGTSFQYCVRRAQEMIGKVPSRMVVCHLGSGASLCAVKDGKSIDTTMGFTPLEGLMMDTRSGTVDPGIVLYLLKTKTAEEVSHELYEKSGLLGLSGISSDMRDILEKADSNPRAKIAIDTYVYRLASMIGSMAVSLGGLDVLVFTAGIGENAALIHEKTCAKLSFLGVRLSESALIEGDRELSAKDSEIKILVIQTQEAFEIARECWDRMNG